jgi:predicted TIM-barrel fold metal-dependent hydrolase
MSWFRWPASIDAAGDKNDAGRAAEDAETTARRTALRRRRRCINSNVFIDTSAYKVRRYPRELVEYMRGNARHRVLFGSNHPLWPAGECIAGLDTLGLAETAEAAFLAGNAQRVFNLN